jgi:RES domain-containing protein
MTAVKEAAQGLIGKLDPLVLCSYEVDCEDIIDLTDGDVLSGLSIDPADLSCGWLLLANAGKTPPSWALAQRLIKNGHAGAIVPSFAPGAAADAHNLVLWKWGADPPYKIAVNDPSGRLPKNALSWT